MLCVSVSVSVHCIGVRRMMFGNSESVGGWTGVERFFPIAFRPDCRSETGPNFFYSWRTFGEVSRDVGFCVLRHLLVGLMEIDR